MFSRLTNYTDGHSQEYDPFLPAQVTTYTGRNATGTLVKEVRNTYGVGSQVDTFDPSSGAWTGMTNYDVTGVLTSKLTIYPDGQSVRVTYNPSSDVSKTVEISLSPTGTAARECKVTDYVDRHSDVVAYKPIIDPALGQDEITWHYDTPDGQGNLLEENVKLSSGSSQTRSYNPNSHTLDYVSTYNEKGELVNNTTNFVEHDGSTIASSITLYNIALGVPIATTYYTGRNGTGTVHKEEIDFENKSRRSIEERHYNPSPDTSLTIDDSWDNGSTKHYVFYNNGTSSTTYDDGHGGTDTHRYDAFGEEIYNTGGSGGSTSGGSSGGGGYSSGSSSGSTSGGYSGGGYSGGYSGGDLGSGSGNQGGDGDGSGGFTLFLPLGYYDSSGHYLQDHELIEDIHKASANVQASSADTGVAIDAVRSGPVADLLNRFVLDHPPTALTRANLLTTDTDLHSSITYAGDTNLFRVAMIAGTTYWFNAEGTSTGQGTISAPYMRLLDADGVTELASGQGNAVGLNSFISYTPPATGTYYMEAGSSNGSTGDYLLTERVADDYPSSPATNGILAAEDAMVGTYDFVADTDWFRAALTAGTTYRFVMDSTPTGPGTQIQPRLKLYGIGGTTQLAADNNNRGGSEASITFAPTTTGTYYVSAESFGSNVGTYRLSESVISGATPSAAAASRMSFIAGNDNASPAATAASGTVMIAFEPAGEVATGMLTDHSVGTVSPDQIFASAGSVIQPQYTASDGIQQSAASLITGLSGYTTSDIQVTPYLSTS